VSYLFVNRGTRDVETKVAVSVPTLPVCDTKHGAGCGWRWDYAEDPNPMRVKVCVEPKRFSDPRTAATLSPCVRND